MGSTFELESQVNEAMWCLAGDFNSMRKVGERRDALNLNTG